MSLLTLYLKVKPLTSLFLCCHTLLTRLLVIPVYKTVLYLLVRIYMKYCFTINVILQDLLRSFGSNLRMTFPSLVILSTFDMLSVNSAKNLIRVRSFVAFGSSG